MQDPGIDQTTLKGKFTPYCLSHVVGPWLLPQNVGTVLEFFNAILILIPNFINNKSKRVPSYECYYVFHVLAIMHCKIHTENNHTLSDYVARVLQCLLIAKLRSDVCVEKVNTVQCFMGFTVELRVKDLQG